MQSERNWKKRNETCMMCLLCSKLTSRFSLYKRIWFTSSTNAYKILWRQQVETDLNFEKMYANESDYSLHLRSIEAIHMVQCPIYKQSKHNDTSDGPTQLCRLKFLMLLCFFFSFFYTKSIFLLIFYMLILILAYDGFLDAIVVLLTQLKTDSRIINRCGTPWT